MVRGRGGKEGEQGEVDTKDLGLPFAVSLMVPMPAEGMTKLPECLEKEIKSSSHSSIICPEKPGVHPNHPLQRLFVETRRMKQTLGFAQGWGQGACFSNCLDNCLFPEVEVTRRPGASSE